LAVAWPFAARAQQAVGLRLIGVLMNVVPRKRGGLWKAR
jgi:hypothetical protein